MRQVPEVAKGDVVIQHRGGEHIALVVGWPEAEGRGAYPAQALQRLNLWMWRQSHEREAKVQAAFRELRCILRRSLGLPTWLPRKVFKWRLLWLLGYKETCERFEALVREVAAECDAANNMRPQRGDRLTWSDVVTIVEGRWYALRMAEDEALIETGGMKVVG